MKRGRWKSIAGWKNNISCPSLPLPGNINLCSLAPLPGPVQHFGDYPILWLIPVLNVVAIANIPRAITKEKPLYAFMNICVTIAALVFLFSAALFPDLSPAANDASNSITIYNAGSSLLTQKIGLIIVARGMPMVLSYTVLVYWTFRGKVELGEGSYEKGLLEHLNSIILQLYWLFEPLDPVRMQLKACRNDIKH